MNSNIFRPYDPFLSLKYLVFTATAHIVTHMEINIGVHSPHNKPCVWLGLQLRIIFMINSSIRCLAHETKKR